MPSSIPTLSEFLEYCASVPGLLLDLEIKVYLNDEGPERVKYTVDETMKMCENLGLGDKIILNSFDAYVLEYIYKTYGKNILYMDIIHIHLWKMSSSIRLNILIMLAIGQAEKMAKRNATTF